MSRDIKKLEDLKDSSLLYEKKLPASGEGGITINWYGFHFGD